VIHIPLDLCMKTGLMYSKAVVREFYYPSLENIISIVKAHGALVSVHIDGCIKDIIEDIINLGVDIINPIETCGGTQDIYELSKKYGSKIAFHGNISVYDILVNGTPKQVETEVKTHIEKLWNNGGYIVASDHNLGENVPLDRIFAMRDAVHCYSSAVSKK